MRFAFRLADPPKRKLQGNFFPMVGRNSLLRRSAVRTDKAVRPYLFKHSYTLNYFFLPLALAFFLELFFIGVQPHVLHIISPPSFLLYPGFHKLPEKK